MFIFIACVYFVPSCSSVKSIDGVSFERVADRTQAEIDFAKTTLAVLQVSSFEKNREYCGYIGLDNSGRYIATQPKRGRKGSCMAKPVSDDFKRLASYHTHGAYSPKFDSELPSSDDLIGDIEDGIDGYIATPGGRVWFSNARAQQVELLCNEACIPQDPNYDVSDMTDIKRLYTLEDLLAFEVQ